MKDAGFIPNNINLSGFSKICDLNVIAKDYILSVKGKIVCIIGTKKVAFRDESCKKQEAMKADPAGVIYVKQLIEGKKITISEIQILYKLIWKVY